MTLVYACIAPHGSEIVPELAGSRGQAFMQTRKGMIDLAKRVLDARPDTIVIASPHSVRLRRNIAVIATDNTSGSVADEGGEISLSAKCDMRLAEKLVDEAEKAGLPVEGLRFAVPSGPLSDFKMDFGTLIPLWFFLKQNRLKSKVVIVAPTRGIPIATEFEFGKVVGKVVASGRRRVVFVASADQAHTHKKSGPYGYNRRAAEYDHAVLDAIRRNDLKSIMELPRDLIEAAKPDSLWQMVMLAGVIDGRQMKLDLVSYQVPTYYGMMCVGCSRG